MSQSKEAASILVSSLAPLSGSSVRSLDMMCAGSIPAIARPSTRSARVRAAEAVSRQFSRREAPRARPGSNSSLTVRKPPKLQQAFRGFGSVKIVTKALLGCMRSRVPRVERSPVDSGPSHFLDQL